MNAVFGPEAWAPLARALVDRHRGVGGVVLVLRSDLGGEERLPVDLFFREGPGLRPPDVEAVRLSRSPVLDVGAGVGAVALELQERGVEVVAAEVIPEAVEIMRERGVAAPLLWDLHRDPAPGRFETVLCLMNGTALAGTLEGLGPLLDRLAPALAPGGQILLDSTDPRGWDAAEDGRYPGELHYQLEYRGEAGAPFPQLFVDPLTLAEVGASRGWKTEVLWEGGEGEYLARLTRSRGGVPPPP